MRLRGLLLTIFLVATALPMRAQTKPSSTLAKVRAAGTLHCGIIQEDAEYSTEDDHGSRGSFDQDLCKAFSIAAIGSKASVIVSSFLDGESAMQSLRAGKIDAIATISADFSHATAAGIRLSPPMFYDGVGFLVPRATGIEHPSGFVGNKICFLAETNVEVELQAWFKQHRLDFLPFPFQEEGEMEAAYITRNCKGLASDVTRLVNIRASFGARAKDYILLPEIISSDPLASATRDDDAQWSNIVTWVDEALISAEDRGLTSSNIASKAASTDPAVAKLLGRTADFGTPLGLQKDWFVQVLTATGNYGEIYDRAFGPTSGRNLPRGANRLSAAGGLLQSLPLK
jgi:general L-amino acid transport system substrate-binding protein